MAASVSAPVYGWVRVMLGHVELLLVGLLVLVLVFTPIIAAVLLVRDRRAQRKRPAQPISETLAQIRWRKTREWEQGDADATEVIPRYRDSTEDG
jgi:hypothetical protein